MRTVAEVTVQVLGKLRNRQLRAGHAIDVAQHAFVSPTMFLACRAALLEPLAEISAMVRGPIALINIRI